MNTGSKGPAYDRQLLLEGVKRNAVLDLTEVQRYRIESWDDPDYVVAKSVPLTSAALVIDPFAGSGNTLYWMVRHLPWPRGFGFEQDPLVFQ